MANVQLWVLRVIATKEILASSFKQFTPIAGEEQNQETIPEEDIMIFLNKYTYNDSGTLIIDGKWYYLLDVSEDAGAHNPANGNPQLDVGGSAYLTATLQKKDRDGNSHTDGSDDDKIYLSAEGGDAVPASVAGLDRGFVVNNLTSQVRKVGTNPATVTGVVVDGASDDTPLGDGTVYFYVATSELSWKANGETEGTKVNVSAGGAFDLYSNSTGPLSVTVTPGSLPGGDTNDTSTISLNDRFVTTKDINTAEVAVIVDGSTVDSDYYTIENGNEVVADTAPEIGSSVNIIFSQIVEGELSDVDLVNGTITFRVYAGTKRGTTQIKMSAEDIADVSLIVETV